VDGCDTPDTPLHQSFLVRHPQPPFIRYFGDTPGTLIAKRTRQGRFMNDFIPSDTPIAPLAHTSVMKRESIV